MPAKYIHVSFDVIESFELRVPEEKSRSNGEDAKTPRICAAPSIIDCIHAIPMAGEVIQNALREGIKPIIHAYYLKPAEKVKIPTINEVMDADLTNEIWLLELPEKVNRVDYEIVDAKITMLELGEKGGKRPYINSVTIRRTKYQDNYKNFFLHYSNGDNKFADKMTEKSKKLMPYRLFMANIDELHTVIRKRKP